MTSLLRFPNEILVLIALYCQTEALARLTRSCKQLNHLLTVHLYRRGLVINPPALVRAAKKRNEVAVQRVLQYTTPSSLVLYDALARAAGNSDEAMTRLLLAIGAPASDSNRRSRESPLYRAAVNRSLPVVQQLLAAGATPTNFSSRAASKIIRHSTKLVKSPGDASHGAPGEKQFDPRILQLLVDRGMVIGRFAVEDVRALILNCPISLLEFLLDLGLFCPLQMILRYRGVPALDSDCARLVKRDATRSPRSDYHRLRNGYLLHICARRRLPATVQALLETGAHVDARDHDGRTPLHTNNNENSQDDVDVICALLDAGADLTAVDNEGKQHILMRTINHNNRPCMRLLLDRGLSLAPAIPPSELMLAAAYLGDSSAVQWLLNQHGAADLLSARDRHRNNALMAALRFGNDDVVELLLGYTDAVDTYRNGKGDSCLHLAMYSAKETTARIMMKCFNDINVRNASNATPLTVAVQFQSPAIVRELIQQGGDITCVDMNGQSLLHHAAIRGDRKVASVLLQCNCPRVSRDQAQQTQLPLIIQHDLVEPVKLCVACDKRVEHRDAHGHTPLMSAVLAHSMETTKMLVEAGADMHAASHNASKQIKSTLIMALDRPQPDLAQYLLDRSAGKLNPGIGETVLVRAIQRQWPILAMTVLRKYGADIEVDAILPYHAKQTALAWAAHIGYVDIVRELLKLDANAYSRNRARQSVLTCAALGGNIEIVKAVVEHVKATRVSGSADIDLDSEDIYGYTPLLTAAFQGDLDVVEWLITHGANQFHKSKHGLTAVDVALRGYHIPTALWLVRRGVPSGMTVRDKNACIRRYVRGDRDLKVREKTSRSKKQGTSVTGTGRQNGQG